MQKINLWDDNRGDRHPNARLTWEEVREMRRMHEDGYALAEIASRFRQVTPTHVREIVMGRAWRRDPLHDHNEESEKA